MQGKWISRRHIKLLSKGRTDENVVIGYDKSLRTFFLGGFKDEETERLEIQLGTKLQEFPSLQSIVEAVRARGYSIAAFTPSYHFDDARIQPGIAVKMGCPISGQTFA